MKTVCISKVFNHLNLSHLLVLIMYWEILSCHLYGQYWGKRSSRRAACQMPHDNKRQFSFHFTANRQQEFQADSLRIKFLSLPFTGYKVLSRDAFVEVCKPTAKETSCPVLDESCSFFLASLFLVCACHRLVVVPYTPRDKILSYILQCRVE